MVKEFSEAVRDSSGTTVYDGASYSLGSNWNYIYIIGNGNGGVNLISSRKTQANNAETFQTVWRFSERLQEDLKAVIAALKLPWSNGQTEGQVNGLKLIKRQMFGRANFDLLRQRVLHAT